MLSKSNLYSIDILSLQPALKVKGESRFTTKSGVVFTVIAVFSLLVLSIFFLIQTFDRQSINLVYNQDARMYPVSNLTDIPFAMAIHGRYALFPEQDRVFSIKAQWVEVFTILDEKGFPTIQFKFTPVPFEKCNIEKHYGKYRSMYAGDMISHKYCITPGTVNMTLYGNWGDTVNGNSHFDVRIFKCDNKTRSGEKPCYDDETISNYLKSAYATINYVDFDIQPKNFQDTISPIYGNEFLEFGTGLYKTFNSIRNNVLIRTDVGFVFEEVNEMSTSNYMRTETIVSDQAEDPYFGVAQYIVIHNKRIEVFSRSYIKFQQLLANIGGVFKAIFFICYLIVNSVSLAEFKLYLINYLFFFGQTSDKSAKITERIKTKNYMSQTSFRTHNSSSPSKAAINKVPSCKDSPK